jgi:hypothetical protein
MRAVIDAPALTGRVACDPDRRSTRTLGGDPAPVGVHRVKAVVQTRPRSDRWLVADPRLHRGIDRASGR